MYEITNHKPSDQEVKGIFADTYRLFIQYKDCNVLEYENEINIACEAIEDKYSGCQLSASLVEAVLRVLIDRSQVKGNVHSATKENNIII
jgi:hypothetical protein